MALSILQGTGVAKNIPLYDPAYSACSQSIAAAVVTTAKDFATLSGAAGVVTRIKRVALTLKSGGTQGGVAVQLIRETTLTTQTGGTVVTPTPAPHDSASAAAASIYTLWAVSSATITNGTGTLVLAAGQLAVSNVSASVAGTPVDRLVWDFTTRGDEPIVLRSALDGIGVRITGTTPSSSTLDCEIWWEEAST